MDQSSLPFNETITNYNLEPVVQQSQDLLQEFAASPYFTEQMQLTFGEEVQATPLREIWADGDLGTLPEIEVLPASEINGANGAFARETNTIYLSQELLNEGNSETITSVFLEEYGHYVDSLITSSDALGDEGRIFASLVQEDQLSEQNLASLKKEDDSTTLEIDGKTVAVEQAQFTVTNASDSGSGSLREAINQANNNSGADTINFVAGLSGNPIELGLPLDITDDLTINGLGADELILDGQFNSRVFTVGDEASDDVTISGVTIRNGFAPAGGGIFNNGNLTLISSHVHSNVADTGSPGGGISNSGTLEVVNSTVSNNESLDRSGGGIYNSAIGDGDGAITVANSTIANNTSLMGGSGIHGDDGGIVRVFQSTIAGNSSSDEDGGGIVNGGDLFLANSIIADHAQNDVVNDGSVNTVSSTLTLVSDNSLSGDQIINQSPILGFLDDHGGPTPTISLIEFSPAVDRNVQIPNDVNDLDGDGNTDENLPYDQRGQGFDRVVDNRIDLGAVEIQEPVNDPPEVNNPISDQNATEDQSFQFQVPDDTFSDPDDEFLIFSANLDDGSDLPEWLNFNTNDLTFSGTPGEDDDGTLNIQVTATDSEGLTASTSFTLNVEEVNDAPVFEQAPFTFDLDLDQAQEFSKTVTATDPEQDDLTFDITSGNDPDGNGKNAFAIDNNGTIGTITVTDAQELQGQDVFNLTLQASDGDLATTAEATINVSSETQNDFNSDGNPDLLWHNPSSGEVQVWFMDGTTKQDTAEIGLVSNSNWNLVATEDFNRDRQTDLVWRNGNTGQNAVWFMDDTERTGVAQLPPTENQNWNLVASGDFNRDSQSDLVWRNSNTGENAVWLMDDTTRIGVSQLDRTSNLNWNLIGTEDFNGDEQDDLLWYNSNTGQNAVWFMDGTSRTGVSQLDRTNNLEWNLVGTQDLNQDNQGDLLWRNESTGENAVWFMDGTERVSASQIEPFNLNWNAVPTNDNSLEETTSNLIEAATLDTSQLSGGEEDEELFLGSNNQANGSDGDELLRGSEEVVASDDLAVTQEGSDTIISLGANSNLVEEDNPLAELEGISPDQLTEEDVTLA